MMKVRDDSIRRRGFTPEGREAMTGADERFDRQRRIPGWDQPALERARFLVAGAGALGNEVAKHLAMLGARQLAVVDMDLVEESNLNRTTFFSMEDLGAPKVDALKRRLEAQYPHCRVDAHQGSLQEHAEAEFDAADVVFGCVDNQEARMLLNSHAVYYRKPYIDGATEGFMGQVRVVVPPYTSCVECHLPPGAYQDIGERFSCTREQLEAMGLPEQHVPAVPTTTSIVAAVSVDEALKVLMGLDGVRATGAWPPGIGRPLAGVLQYDARSNRHQVVPVAKNPRCHICGMEGVRAADDYALRLRTVPRLTLKGLYRAVARRARLTGEFLVVSGLSPLPDDADLSARVGALELKSRLLQNAPTSVRDKRRGERIREPSVTREPKSPLPTGDAMQRLRRVRRMASGMTGERVKRMAEEAARLAAWARGQRPLEEYGVEPDAVLTVVRPTACPVEDFNVFLERGK